MCPAGQGKVAERANVTVDESNGCLKQGQHCMRMHSTCWRYWCRAGVQCAVSDKVTYRLCGERREDAATETTRLQAVRGASQTQLPRRCAREGNHVSGMLEQLTVENEIKSMIKTGDSAWERGARVCGSAGEKHTRGVPVRRLLFSLKAVFEGADREHTVNEGAGRMLGRSQCAWVMSTVSEARQASQHREGRLEDSRPAALALAEEADAGGS